MRGSIKKQRGAGRVATAVLTAALVLLQALGLLASPARSAASELSSTTVTSVEGIGSYFPDISQAIGVYSFFRVDNSADGLAFCARKSAATPDAGTRYADGRRLGDPKLDYVLYHGWSEESQTGYGCTSGGFLLATMYAIWACVPGYEDAYYENVWHEVGLTYGSPAYPNATQQGNVYDAIHALVSEAQAYAAAGGGGPEQGCAIYWASPNGSLQSLVTRARPDVTVSFTKTSADVSVTDGSPEYELSGATYQIYRASDDALVATVTTDDQGHASCRLARNTSYYAVETAAPAGFVPSGGRVEFSTADTDLGVSLTDEPGTATLTLRKRDAATGDAAQPGLSLGGAEFTLTAENGTTLTATSDESGTVRFEGVPLGAIRVVETKAPEGYRIDPTVREYHASAGQLTDMGVVELVDETGFSEVPQAFDLEIAKFTDDETAEGSGLEVPAEGVQFQIVSNTTSEVVGTIQTNEAGYADTSRDPGLWLGTGTRPEGASGAIPYDRMGYTIREVASTVPEGFGRVGDWELSAAQMADGAKLQYIADDHVLSARVQVVKVDAATGATVPLAGFSFQVLDAEGNPVTQESWYPSHVELSEFVTDETGTLTLPERLTAGTYRLRETGAQSPYLLGTEDMEFRVGEGEEPVPLVTLRYEDSPATGAVSVAKADAGSGDAVRGAEFDVVAQESVVSPDGTTQAVEGQVMGSLVTGEDGTATLEGLPLGSGSARYALVETKAPQGYVRDPTPHEFTLSYEDGATAVVWAHVGVENDYTKVDVSKRSVTGEDEVEGARLTVTDAEGNVVDTWTSQAEPHRIERLAPGTYVLTEEMAPRTYEKAASVTFEVKETGEVQQVVMRDEPIEVSTQVDKRQEPIGEDGTYRYGVDFRSTSTTWADELTLTDRIAAATDGLARLVAIRTPRVTGDADGLLNVWYQTNLTPADHQDASDANATLTEGLTNPWLADDGREVSYAGWRLWREGVSATEAEELRVEDLPLEEGEHVTAVRLEYGRVEMGFTSRQGAWDRDGLKDERDDVDDATMDHDESHAPLVLAMRACEAASDGAQLRNDAQVEIYRNGGGQPELEDSDEDHVVQALAEEEPLPSAGDAGHALVAASLAGAGLLTALGAAVARRR